MKTFARYGIVTVVALLCFWFWLQKCNNVPGPDHTQDKVFVDSVTNMVKGKLAEFQHVYDSVKAANVVLQKDKDSLVGVVAAYKIDLKSKGNDIQDLINSLDESEDAKDTLRQLTLCDSLKGQFASAKGLVGAYIHANDSLSALNNQIITSKDAIIGRLNGMFTDANNSLFQVGLKYDQLYADYKRLNVKPKRFGIGPSIGYYATPNGLKPGLGISFTFSIIKF